MDISTAVVLAMRSCRQPVAPAQPALLVALALLALAVAVSAESVGERCSKPNIRQGTCISIRECPVLLALLERPQPNLSHLQQASCGFLGNVPVVCCPDAVSRPGTGTGTSPGTSPVLQDVSHHHNLRLLPMDTCGPLADSRIFGGNETGVLEFPWMALIGYSIRGAILYRCGGSLVNDKYVVTAAHCVTSLPASYNLAGVRLGEHDLDKETDCDVESLYCAPPPLNFDIEEALPHQQYSRREMKNDIALIRLRGRVDFTQSPVRAICLPVGLDHQNRNLDKEKMIVAGWGTTESGSASSVQLKVIVPVVPLQRCRPIYEKTTQIGPTQLCAGGEKGHDSCTGDSGGPLFFLGLVGKEQKTVQYGVVSFGPRNCGTEGMPGVYTRMGYYMEWVLNSMKP